MLSRTLVCLVFVIGATTVRAEDPFQETARRINAERQMHKLSKLKYNDKLAKAAQSQSDWMASVGKMEHLRGKEATSFEEWKKSNHHTANRMIHAGYFKWDELYSIEVKDGNQFLIGKPGVGERMDEVIAHGVPESGPDRFKPAVIVAGWMNSPPHRKSILTEHCDELGVGFTRTKRGDAYWCVVFGKK